MRIVAFVKQELEVGSLGVKDLTATCDESIVGRLSQAVTQPNVGMTVFKTRQFPRGTSSLGIKGKRESPCNAAPAEVGQRFIVENLEGYLKCAAKGLDRIMKVEIC